MRDVDRLFIFLLFGLVLFSSGVNSKWIIAAVEDNGCASHIEMPAPKNLQRKDTYKDDNG